MKSLKIYICVFISTLTLWSCSKEIDFPFRNIDPIYVVEGRLSEELIEVVVTKTINMSDTQKSARVSNAVVTISSNSISETLVYDEEDGAYRPSVELDLVIGEDYKLKVEVDGKSFESTSKMCNGIEIVSSKFLKFGLSDMDVILFRSEFNDILDEVNYYYIIFKKNDEISHWFVMHDKGSDRQKMQADIFFFIENEKNKDDEKSESEKNKDRILRDGDVVELEIKSIDRNAYDYLYSLSLSSGSTVNPIDNFKGGCLGYFSAYSSAKTTITFNVD